MKSKLCLATLAAILLAASCSSGGDGGSGSLVASAVSPVSASTTTSVPAVSGGQGGAIGGTASAEVSQPAEEAGVADSEGQWTVSDAETEDNGEVAAGMASSASSTTRTTGYSPTSYPQCQPGAADAFSQTGRPEESSNIVNEFPELEWKTATRNWKIKAGTGDPTGCADGSENRSDHTTTSAGTARKQNPAPAFAASARTDTSVPPSDADGGSMVCTFCYNIGV